MVCVYVCVCTCMFQVAGKVRRGYQSCLELELQVVCKLPDGVLGMKDNPLEEQ